MANENPYLELVSDNATQGGVGDNPYAPLLQSDTAQQVRGSVANVAEINPDVDARLQKLATQYGVPIDAVRLDPKPLERKAQLDSIDYAELARKAPGTANFMADPKNAAVSHDDVGNMSLLETVWNSFKRGVPSLKRNVSTTALNANANTIGNIDRVEQLIAEGRDPDTITADIDPIGVAQMTPDQRKEMRQQSLEKIREQSGNIATNTMEMLAIPQNPVVGRVMDAGKSEGLEGSARWAPVLKEFAKNPVDFIASIGPESLVANAPGLALAIPATMAGGPAGGAAVMGASSFTQSYASTILEALQEKGVDVKDPAAVQAAMQNPELVREIGQAAFSKSAMISLFDAASFGVASKAGLPGAIERSLANKPFTKQMINTLLVQPPVQGAMGAAGEFAGQTVAGQEIDPGAILAEFAGEFFGAPAEVVTASAKRAFTGIQDARAAEDNAKLLAQLDDLAAASKVRSRDTATFESFVASATENAPVQEVFINAEVLAQSGMAEQLAQVSPSVAEQFEAALDTGNDIRIPVAEYTARIAGTEFSQGLLEHLKTDPEGFSLAEAKEYMQSYAEELKADVERTLAAKQGDEAFKAQIESVKINIKTQLDTAARFTPQVNDAYASMIGNFYGVMAGKVGIAPDELLARYPLRVQAQSVVNGQQFDQSGNRQYPMAPEGEWHGEGTYKKDGGRLVQVTPDEYLAAVRPLEMDTESRENVDLLKKHIEDGKKLDPLLIRANGKEDGRHRAMAAKELGIAHVPVIAYGEQFNAAPTYAPKVLNQDSESDLVVTHNLSAANVLHSIKMGGIPVPSLAVTKKGTPLTGFGEVTLIGSKDLVDPKTGAKVFGADIYSPRYPQISYNLDKHSVAALNAELASYQDGRQIYGSDITGIDDLTSNPAFKAYAADKIGATASWDATKTLAQELLQNVGAKERIFKGFTYSGNRTYTPHTLDNVVKILKKELRGGENFNYGVGSMRAKFTPQFKSIAQIRKAKGRLIDKASFETVKKEIDTEFFAVAEAMGPNLNLDTVTAILEDAPKMGLERAAKYFNVNLTPEAKQLAVEFMNKLRDLPTEYFEAKLLREVSLGEFSGAVVPDDLDPKVIEALKKQGLTDIRTYKSDDPADRAAKIGEFENLFFQDREKARGAFNPATNTITLLKNADLSTFLHESGHFFLETQFDISARIAQEVAAFGSEGNTPGQQQILEDTNALLKWFGIADLNEWNSLDFEEKRSYHERFARGFEAYLFEGKAPSIEVQGVFQRFRAWLLNVYKDLKALNVELTDEVRSVFDRMLATNEQIATAEQAQSMMELFTTPSQPGAGMTPEEFAAYQALGVDATNDAIQDLQARGLRDLAWARNARGREIKKLQKQAAARRAEVTIDVRREVMSQPIYRAWQFLTGKLTADDKITPAELPKSDPNVLYETVDSLFTAIAKLGGLDRAQVESQWGFDTKERSPMPAFGKYTLRRDGGLTIDAMAERLAELGYLSKDENGRFDQRELEEKFDAEMRGDVQYSMSVDERILRGVGKAGEDVNLDALGAGRLDAYELGTMGLPESLVDIIKNLKMTAKNGLHPDLVAEMFGFTSGDELVRTLAIAQEPKQEINDLVDTRMLELYGELATPEAIEREADKAIHNENRARVIATEANALAKATGKPKILASAARDFARTMIARLKIRDIRPSQYAAAEVRAAKAAQKASQAGDIAQAAAEKRNQLVNTYATRAAYDAQDEVESGVRYLKKFDNEGTRKNLDTDYLDQIDALLERFDLRKISNKAADKRTALAAWLKSQEDQGLVPEIPEDLQNEAFRKPYKEMTVEELRGLIDSVKQIEHLGRLKNRLLTAASNKAFVAVRDEIAQSIEDNAGNRTADTRTPTTNMGRVLDSMKKFYASHIKAATWARVMDGGNDGGAVWEYFVRPANVRGDMETTMRATATNRLSEILAPVFKLGKMGGKGVFFPTIGRSLNREARLTIALNTGNQGNLQRLLGGEGWTVAQIQPVLNSLTAAEWTAVQQIWDHFESYRPEIAAKERRVYGKEPDWVEPTPFQVKTTEGQTVDLRGGYYPIKYDPAASQRAEEYADAEGAKRQLQGAFTSATTRRSFTKARSEEIVGRPLLYTLAGLYSGVNDVIHDLAWHEWLIDANRLLRSQKIDAAMRDRYGPQVKAQFKTWANDIAEGDKGSANAGEMALSRLRQGVSAAGLGFNVMSAAMQVLGFTQSIVRIGPTHVGRGITQYMANPLAAAREVNGQSDFMANRSRTQFRELNELRNKVQDESVFGSAVKQGAFYLMMRAQQMVDIPTWLGAYDKAIHAGNSDERSVQLADQAVIDAQGGGQLKDLSGIERGGPALKLFTVFYSFMNTTLNLAVGQTMTANTPAKKAKLAADYLLLFTVPAVLGSLMKEALTPGGGDEDWDKLAKKLVAEQISYLMGTMVVAREFAEAAKIVTGAEGVRGYSGPAGVRMIADSLAFLKQAKQGDFDDAFRKSAINLIGDFSGLPAAQVNRTITGVQALNEGKTKNPASVLFGFDRK